MSSDQPNPYATPLVADVVEVSYEGNIDPASMKKIEAIIKDARQFWIAILLCLVCSGFGFLLIGPWYLVRLVQWTSVARVHPELLERDSHYKSLAQRFQSAKIRLIIGMSFGAIIFLLVGLLFMATTLISATAVN